MFKAARGSSFLTSGQLLTVGEVCDRTKLSASTIRRALRANDLPHHKFGTTIRVSEADLQLYLSRSHSNRRM